MGNASLDGSFGLLTSPISARQRHYCWSIVKCTPSLPSPHRQPPTVYIRLDACMSHLSWLAAPPLELLLLRVNKGVWISTYYASLLSATYAPDPSRRYAPMQFSSIVTRYPYPSILPTAVAPFFFSVTLRCFRAGAIIHGGVILFDVLELIPPQPSQAPPDCYPATCCSYLQASSTTGAACLPTCVLQFAISSADILCCECSEHAVSSRPRRHEAGKM